MQFICWSRKVYIFPNVHNIQLAVLLGVDDGISIPCSYTSYLSPLQSPKLYNEIRNCREKDKHFLAHFETPYVVYLHNKKELAPSQPLFTFSHPNRGDCSVIIDKSSGMFVSKKNFAWTVVTVTQAFGVSVKVLTLKWWRKQCAVHWHILLGSYLFTWVPVCMEKCFHTLQGATKSSFTKQEFS